MKNKKGFTLVELLGVLVVLAVILMIAYPLITAYVRNTKQKAYDAQMEIMLVSLRDYVNEHKEWLPENDGEYVTLTLGQLKASGIIKNSVINPLDGKEIEDSMEFKIIKNGTRYQYEIVENSVETRESEEHSPTVEIYGSPIVYYPINSTYSEIGVKGFDYSGTELTVTIDNKVDMTANGIYLIKYTVVDANGIYSYAYRTIIVGNGGIGKNYNIGDVVYYNPEENRTCSDYVEENSEPEVTTGCLKWYVYKIEEDGYRIILDHNTSQDIDRGIESNVLDANGFEHNKGAKDEIAADTVTWNVDAEILKATDAFTLLEWYKGKESTSFADVVTDYTATVSSMNTALSKLDNSQYAFYGKYVIGTSLDGLKNIISTIKSTYSDIALPEFMYKDLLSGCDNTGYCDSFGYWLDIESHLVTVAGYISEDAGSLPKGVRPTIKISK